MRKKVMVESFQRREIENNPKNADKQMTEHWGTPMQHYVMQCITSQLEFVIKSYRCSSVQCSDKNIPNGKHSVLINGPITGTGKFSARPKMAF